jgi:hypothetical protein
VRAIFDYDIPTSIITEPKYRSTHKDPIRAYDAHLKQQVRLKLQCHCGPGDNPSQSESSGHIGGNGNYPCRKCGIGGSQKEKETDKGFEQFFEVRTSVL